MDIMELGAIGDFVGGVAVLVTLFYLAIQVRQSTASARTSSYQGIVSSVSEWSRSVGLSADAARILQAGRDGRQGLSAEDRARFDSLYISLTRNLENIHYQYLEGVISDSTWEGWDSRIHGVFAQPGARGWWAEQSGAYSPAFRELIESGSMRGVTPAGFETH